MSTARCCARLVARCIMPALGLEDGRGCTFLGETLAKQVLAGAVLTLGLSGGSGRLKLTCNDQNHHEDDASGWLEI